MRDVQYVNMSCMFVSTSLIVQLVAQSMLPHNHVQDRTPQKSEQGVIGVLDRGTLSYVAAAAMVSSTHGSALQQTGACPTALAESLFCFWW